MNLHYLDVILKSVVDRYNKKWENLNICVFNEQLMKKEKCLSLYSVKRIVLQLHIIKYQILIEHYVYYTWTK